MRPNLLAWEGDEYRFIGPAPRSSRNGLELPNDLAHLEDGVIRVGCGHCISCRVRRAMEWKIRGYHEMLSTYRPTYAVTLTYDEDHLPESGSLRKDDLRSFHRRLRYNSDSEFRFLACGEYGPTTGRAHYHAIYFGLVLPDSYKSGQHVVSQVLRDSWGNGHVACHEATVASIGYVSGYVVKKLRSQRGVRPIMETVDFETGAVIDETEVSGEFLQASNRPGIGAAWIDQFGDQVLEQGFIVVKDRPCYIIPTYYLKKLRDRPGFPEFVEKRLAKVADAPTLTPEQLASLGVALEGDMARRLRSGV